MKGHISSKVVVNIEIVEQVNTFNCPGFTISLIREPDINRSVERYNRNKGTIKRTLIDKNRREIKMKSYDYISVPAILY